MIKTSAQRQQEIEAAFARIDEVLDKKLEVMDLTAICLCRDHDMPVRVFEMEKKGALLNIVRGGDDGTLIE